MCDIVVEKNISKERFPEFVYKRVQRIGVGEYVSAVMGEPLKLGVWKSAPIRKKEKYRGTDLVVLLKRKLKIDKLWVTSSPFEDHHNGKWASFAYQASAKNSSMVSNFYISNNIKKPYPTVVVKCQVGGVIHRAKWNGSDTYLSSTIKIIEEV